MKPGAKEGGEIGVLRSVTSAERLIDTLTGRCARQLYDAEVKWLSKKGKPSKSPSDAAEDASTLISRIRKLGRGDSESIKMARRIERCRPPRRCLSPACPKCQLATQQFVVVAGGKLVDEYRGPLVIISIVCSLGERPVDSLDRAAFVEVRKRVRAALRAVDVPWALVGLDVSVNEHRDGYFDPHFHVHAWAIAPAFRSAADKKDFRGFFERSDTVVQAVRILKFDRHVRGIAYVYKADFDRRITLDGELRDDGKWVRQTTRHRPLTVDQSVSLASVLNRMHLFDRLLLHRLKLTSTDAGMPEFRRLTRRRP